MNYPDWIFCFFPIPGRNFLPTWEKVRKEREDCLPENCEFTDDVATGTIKSTLDKFMQRHLLDLEEKEKVEKLKEKHGNKIRFKLLYKLGYDGSSQTRYKVRKN